MIARHASILFVLTLVAALLSGCFTDAATRLAYDIKAAARRLGSEEGARYTLEHHTPSKAGECVGNYKVQIDQVGAIIIWCYGSGGSETVSSHSTSYHRRYVDTARTFLLEKRAGETLSLDLVRRNGRIVIVEVR